jgi:hypothetical protein
MYSNLAEPHAEQSGGGEYCRENKYCGKMVKYMWQGLHAPRALRIVNVSRSEFLGHVAGTIATKNKEVLWTRQSVS